MDGCKWGKTTLTFLFWDWGTCSNLSHRLKFRLTNSTGSGFYRKTLLTQKKWMKKKGQKSVVLSKVVFLSNDFDTVGNEINERFKFEKGMIGSVAKEKKKKWVSFWMQLNGCEWMDLGSSSLEAHLHMPGPVHRWGFISSLAVSLL